MKTFSIPDQKPANDLRFGRLVKEMQDSDIIETSLKDDSPIQQRLLHSIALATRPEKIKYL